LYIREIDEATEMGMCGAKCDCNMWKKVKEAMQNELCKKG
jgi:hypothetical protein